MALAGRIAVRTLLTAGAVATGYVAGRVRKRSDIGDAQTIDLNARRQAQSTPSVLRTVPDRGEPLTPYRQLSPESTDEARRGAPRQRWMQPIDGKCPPTHLLKARFATGKYHRPGDRAYDKIVPDCCYATEEEAKADGFSHARW